MLCFSMVDEATKKTLISRACEMQQHAYAPYSRFKVGAALLTASGEIYGGTNVENVSFPLGCCAERNVVYHAVGHGEREFIAMAVVTDNGGGPCGGCRQVMREFNQHMLVYICNSRREVVNETSVDRLLPHSFGPEDLEI